MDISLLVLDIIAVISLIIGLIFLNLNKKYEDKPHLINPLSATLILLIIYILLLIVNNVLELTQITPLAELIILPLAMIILLVFTFVSKEELSPHKPNEPTQLS